MMSGITELTPCPPGSEWGLCWDCVLCYAGQIRAEYDGEGWNGGEYERAEYD